MIVQGLNGKSLFVGRCGEDTVKFVCLSIGYVIARNDEPWGRVWDIDEIQSALDCYLSLIDHAPAPAARYAVAA